MPGFKRNYTTPNLTLKRPEVSYLSKVLKKARSKVRSPGLPYYFFQHLRAAFKEKENRFMVVHGQSVITQSLVASVG